ncbi:MAG: phosphoglycolate phosphatase [Gallionellales bacterium 35-53-114]|jgi:phosphoglycolate phosphatase|nr:MAG: phosphoglycolate phosphatase [Gallionellales bacterium 35-53-114]OYZ65344.1 MAG: phosphoglycolate phosphatase [Gallionellales bacterium 24-53-125]OZB08251.1 MAG: phosphoglycolate phosphatase [Gallionellales bacterium 39-52-133]HQS73736.1 HAD-IA family hydrolase [Gallionellaceae bacterium]
MIQSKTAAVLFDLDGTFADTAPDLGAALNHVRGLHHLPPLPLEITRLQASHGSAGLIKLGFNVEPDSEKFPALRDALLAHYSANICAHTTLFPGMAELIETLEQRGLPWGIVTNKPQRFTLPLMQALGYAERAACLVSGDTCAHAKPHPEPMLYAARSIGVAPLNCLYLGDDRRDMEAGNAAGMRSLIALFGYIDPGADLETWQADAAIATPLDLIDHLKL